MADGHSDVMKAITTEVSLSSLQQASRQQGAAVLLQKANQRFEVWDYQLSNLLICTQLQYTRWQGTLQKDSVSLIDLIQELMGLADEMDDDLKTYQRLIKSYTDLLLLEKHTCKLLPHG